MAENNNQEQGNINHDINFANAGLNLDQTLNQIPKGKLTYALNAALENFDSNSVNYQNEPGNEFCLEFPKGYVVIANHYIQEKSKHIFFITNPSTNESEIGYMLNNDCQYRKLVNANCLGWDVRYPIHKIVHRITNCAEELFWADNVARRYLNLEKIPYQLKFGADLCTPEYTDELDCNKLKIQPNFDIPELYVEEAVARGNLTAGTVQFAVQYADSSSNPYTSYYSITNPTPISDPNIVTPNFNYNVGKSVVLNITNLDTTGLFQYFNLAVIKTVNNIPSVELVGTYFIETETKKITYSGQNVEQIRLSIYDIFEKFPYYEKADDLTAVQDVLVWKGLTSVDRINYQSIASKIDLKWETYKIPAEENYSNEAYATNLRSYLRDEVYPFEAVFLLKNGKQTDRFHIPGRAKNIYDLSFPNVPVTSEDFIGNPSYIDANTGQGMSPWWAVYNTAQEIGDSLSPPIGKAVAHKFGEFAYHESTETYPCNESVWGDLAGQPIRHHKFPDVLVSPIYEDGPIIYNPNGTFTPTMQKTSVFPIGVRIDLQQIKSLIANSELTNDQKEDIVGIKIVRGDRTTNKSIVAKGILRNVGSYEREEQTYYFANYPYNEINEDPFLNDTNNAYSQLSEPWLIQCFEEGKYEYTDPNTNKRTSKDMSLGIIEICSLTRPTTLSGRAMIGPGNYDVWFGTACFGCKGYRVSWNEIFTDDNTSYEPRDPWLNSYGFIPGGGCDDIYGRVEVDGSMESDCHNPTITFCKCNSYVVKVDEIEQEPGMVAVYNGVNISGNQTLRDVTVGRRSKLKCNVEVSSNSIGGEGKEMNKYRQIFNSPETSFAQPFLGNVLKLEQVIFGGGKAHFVEVKKNAKYKLLSKEAQIDALDSCSDIARITSPFNTNALFAAYQAYLTIYINGITRKNYAYSYNSIASYDYYKEIPNGLGVKQRKLDLKQYIIPGVQNVGDNFNINNYNRETSVYLKTTEEYSALPFPSDSPNLLGTNIIEKSRLTIGSSEACNIPGKEQDITVVSYYASLKNVVPNQWGQIYSYESVDTGFQKMLTPENTIGTFPIFGGDTYITRFAFKTKLPFFIDNRVGAPDDSDIFYDEIGNIAYPKYWHSARSILENYTIPGTSRTLSNFVSYKAHNFDCPNDPSTIPAGNIVAGTYRTFYDGYFYLFAYGIPSFFCESSYNVDLRQAFNNKEGDFYPHVSTGIPDEWLQESFVSILNDNTYTYNVTFSKQNKENFFSFLPPDWEDKLCFTHYPFRAIFSEPQVTNSDIRVNNWLIYRPAALFDFPQNYGKLTSVDGIDNRQVLARFENKSLLYNAMYTTQTNTKGQVYLGQSLFSAQTPPLDFAETDLGYVGSQNKFLLKIPQGVISIDAKRGQVFLLQGNQAVDLTGFNSGVNRFFTDHLAFEILNYFPNANTDNHFNGLGLHGVYDSKFERVIITKLDYIPIDDDIKYDENLQEFYVESEINGGIERTTVYLKDPEYFCNRSWTMSFNLNTKTWISFHSYLPNWYIGDNNFFYSGISDCCSNIDGSFTLQIGYLDKNRIETTTSTTTKGFIPSTTTTTTLALNCTIEGEAVALFCEFAGEAEVLVPSTPTTTICQRPFDLNNYILFTGYEITGDPAVVSTGSFQEVCEAVAVVRAIIPNVNLSYITTNSIGLNLSDILYLDETMTDCTLVPDGWYFTEEGLFGGFAINVENGSIISINYCECGTTTSTTTISPSLPACCSVLYEVEDSLIYLDGDNNQFTLDVPEYLGSLPIGMTAVKLWDIDTSIREWDITLSPFSAYYNRNVILPASFSTSVNFTGKTNTVLIAINDFASPEEVVELDISGGTAIMSSIFTLPATRSVVSNIIYTNTDKILFITYDNITLNYYLTQYDYTTNVLEIDVNMGSTALNILFECNCNIYIGDSLGNLNVFIKENSVIEPVENLPILPNFVTQINSCTEGVEIITTTTSTTVI